MYGLHLKFWKKNFCLSVKQFWHTWMQPLRKSCKELAYSRYFLLSLVLKCMIFDTSYLRNLWSLNTVIIKDNEKGALCSCLVMFFCIFEDMFRILLVYCVHKIVAAFQPLISSDFGVMMFQSWKTEFRKIIFEVKHDFLPNLCYFSTLQVHMYLDCEGPHLSALISCLLHSPFVLWALWNCLFSLSNSNLIDGSKCFCHNTVSAKPVFMKNCYLLLSSHIYISV
jgi:hypothetical protein